MGLHINAEILANSAAGLSDFDITTIKSLKPMVGKRVWVIDRLAMHNMQLFQVIIPYGSMKKKLECKLSSEMTEFKYLARMNAIRTYS